MSKKGKPPKPNRSSASEGLKPGTFSEPREIARQFIASISGMSLDSLHTNLLEASKRWGRLEWDAVILGVLECLEASDPLTRLGAGAFLLLTRRATDRAVRAFAGVLDGSDYELRVRALSILLMLERIPKPLKPTLGKLLDDEDEVLRVAAAATLRDQPKTFTILRDALFAENPGVVLVASSALGRSGKWVSHAVEALLRLLKEADSAQERLGIVSHLSAMKEKAKDAGPVFFRLLADPETEPQVRTAILLALGEMGLGAEAEIALLEAMRSGDVTTVCMAILSLRDMGAISHEVIEVLIVMLQSPSVEVRGGAVWMLGVLGAQAAEAVPALVNLLTAESDYEFGQEIGKVIQQIVPATFPGSDEIRTHALVTELIFRATQEQQLDLIRLYVNVIASFGNSAIPALIDLIRRADRNAGIAVACLALIGEEAAVVVVETLLNAQEKQVRELGAAALAEMGPLAASAIPALIRLLEQGDEDVLADVLRALRAIGPEAHEATPALISLVLDGNSFVSSWAGSALLAIGPGAAKTIHEAIRRADEDGKKRLKAILDQAGEPYSEPDGIEVVRDQGLLIIDSLRTFQMIGQICKDRQTDKFTFMEMEKQIGIHKSTIQDQLDAVSVFFRNYFMRYEGVATLNKDIDPGQQSHKIFDRGKGKKPSICQPFGWKAWELTNSFIQKRDDLNLARRRMARNRS